MRAVRGGGGVEGLPSACTLTHLCALQIVQSTWILSNITWVWGDLFHPNDVVCGIMQFDCPGDR
jgi:hypothetical protein